MIDGNWSRDLLSNLDKADERDGAIRAVHRFLLKYGYIEGPPPAAMRGENRIDEPPLSGADTDLTGPLQLYQTHRGLPVTGELDERTIHSMLRPRCEFADILPPPAVDSMQHAISDSSIRYNTDLGFIPSGLSAFLIDRAFQQAFEIWRQATHLNFIHDVNSPGLKVLFHSRNHPDGGFDGIGRTVGHGFSVFSQSPYAGEAHFDPDENWTMPTDIPATDPYLFGLVDLVSVAVHEIGHALGLEHKWDRDSAMYPEYQGPHRYLSASDISDFRSLHGL